ncbi:helix-turn-helix domain-containing protein [Pantoea trifolii]|uniref:Helix-turn-helix domain-containing protein n=1 Tax=Pantoea trifolii TaxID=2968030 RepID=A0ABT1VFZ1_9GAMM|nr:MULTISPECIES: helix-turn-helix domain-containing protein [unclassified Pantoea]MCQ8226423.1 helix-turn-helix domain-containing protein [Pantoea sp. MMK2]MCQ8238343.1 helix-turn-helix domain-containing protein [Pantoea sp. MMK3]
MTSTGFLMMPNNIMAIKEVTHNGKQHKLTFQTKGVYCYLSSLSDSFEMVRPSMQGIADWLGLTDEQAARREVKKLADAGLIEIISRPGTSNAFIVKPFPVEQPETQQEVTQQPETVQDVQTPAPALEAVTEKHSDCDDDIIPELMHGYSAPVRSLHLGETVTPLRTTAAENDALEDAKRRVANNKTPLITPPHKEDDEPF